MEAVFIGSGTGKGVVVLRVPANTPISEKNAAIKDAQVLAKSHSSKSRVYRVNWAEYHRKKQISLL